MQLDLLYEVDVPKPWEGGHPWGQRREEQRAYLEALEQIKLSDLLGFHTSWAVEHPHAAMGSPLASRGQYLSGDRVDAHVGYASRAMSGLRIGWSSPGSRKPSSARPSSSRKSGLPCTSKPASRIMRWVSAMPSPRVVR